jgi:ketosteroid isomerase-like protein
MVSEKYHQAANSLQESPMKPWLAVLTLIACILLVTFGRTNARPALSNLSEDDVRKMEQAWLDAASVPDLPALRRMLSDDFMGTSFGGGVLRKNDVIPAEGVAANHFPEARLKESTVRIFGDTAVLMGTVEMRVPQKPEEIRMTSVFQKHDGVWQLIAVHMSKD